MLVRIAFPPGSFLLAQKIQTYRCLITGQGGNKISSLRSFITDPEMVFGHAYFVDYETYKPSDITKILTQRRSIQTLDKRGRPRGKNETSS